MAPGAFEAEVGNWGTIRLERVASLPALLALLGEVLESGTTHCVVISGERFGRADTVASPEELRRLSLFALPLVFASEGDLAGVECDVALGCDIRVCGPEATLQAPSWNSPRVERLLGRDSANGLEDGTSLAAQEALALGLVSHVTDGETALDYGSRLAASIASRGPIATRLGKEAIWRGLEMPLEQALRFETDLTLLLQTTEDRAEGVRAFIEKRAPKFTGD
ncbi:MAG: enoyl-CoA hydratase-related protein [Tepidiformaceae bacterium]